MGLKDLIITPVFLVIFIYLAYWIRPAVTNLTTKKYFLPALIFKFFGAILLGFIYQFYYEGGDTFNFFTHGSRYIWEAFLDRPVDGLRLALRSGRHHIPHLFEYSQHIWYWSDPSSYFVIRASFFAGVFTLHTYSTTALFFAVFSFSGSWALFCAVQNKYQKETKWLALGILFFPSVILWGSGILKDTLTLGALGWMTWGLIRLIDGSKWKWKELLAVTVGLWIVIEVKIYIAISYVPLIIIWFFFKKLSGFKNPVLKILTAPLLILFFGAVGFFTLKKVSDLDSKYKLENIAERARITAYDIRYGWGARFDGEGGYDIGLPDGTLESMVMLAPAAINVSLFRPYLWEVKNPLMILASLESLMLFIFFLRFFIFKKGYLKLWKDPFLIFCLMFALLFAFAVGVSTFNFGTLMRYKIPLIPFFWILIIVSGKRKNLKQV